MNHHLRKSSVKSEYLKVPADQWLPIKVSILKKQERIEVPSLVSLAWITSENQSKRAVKFFWVTPREERKMHTVNALSKPVLDMFFFTFSNTDLHELALLSQRLTKGHISSTCVLLIICKIFVFCWHVVPFFVSLGNTTLSHNLNSSNLNTKSALKHSESNFV